MTLLEKQKADILCSLIKDRKVIKFYYTDTTKNHNDWRIVEPYLVGIHKNTNSVQLRAWYLPTQQQILTGEKQGWRLYKISSISQIQATDNTFLQNRPGYNPNDSDMKQILCRV